MRVVILARHISARSDSLSPFLVYCHFISFLSSVLKLYYSFLKNVQVKSCEILFSDNIIIKKIQKCRKNWKLCVKTVCKNCVKKYVEKFPIALWELQQKITFHRSAHGLYLAYII